MRFNDYDFDNNKKPKMANNSIKMAQKSFDLLLYSLYIYWVHNIKIT